MTTLKELLWAVEHDECSTAILADWLEEHGDQRAADVRAHGPLAVLSMLAPEGRCPMKRIPRGTFWMSENGVNAVKQVEIPYDFYMGIYPVTQAQWQAVMDNNPSWFSRGGGGKEEVKDISEADLNQFPVERVSWENAQEFLAKLNQRHLNSEWLYRLPTEVEWEYSCRGGASSKKDCSFDFYLNQPTNDLSSHRANFNGNFPASKASRGPYLERPTRVGSYQPNRLGLYDLHGNVWEWCEDRYEEASDRVIRGGSWFINASLCRAAHRSWLAPSIRDYVLGFRLARVPVGKGRQVRSGSA